MTREIPLTQGKAALVDDEDYYEMSKHRWCVAKDGNTWYAIRASPRDPVTHKYTMIRMHAAIAGTPNGMETDHINGDGLDNRRENLRVVTRRENLQNRHAPKTSKHPGVTWNKQQQKWKVQIWFNSKKHYLGYYDDEQTAATVYAVASKSLVGV